MSLLYSSIKKQERNLHTLRESPSNTLAQNKLRSSSYRRQFMELMLYAIKEKEKHPLRFLISNGTWNGRRYLGEKTHPFSLQAGHVTSRFSGAIEFFALEDTFSNQALNWHVESKGHLYTRKVIAIQGVPVMEDTARMWKEMHETDPLNGLSPEIFTQSPETKGWSPVGLSDYRSSTLH